MFGSLTPCIPTLVQNIPALSVAFSSPHFNRIKQDFIFLSTPLFHRNKSVIFKKTNKNSITNISHHIKVSFSPVLIVFFLNLQANSRSPVLSSCVKTWIKQNAVSRRRHLSPSQCRDVKLTKELFQIKQHLKKI